MALGGALFLVFVILIRPQEFIEPLRAFSIPNVATGLALLGVVVEYAIGRIRTLWSPQLPWLLSFVAWSVLATLIKVGVDPVLDMKTTLLLALVFMLIVLYAVSTIRRLRAMGILLVLLSVALSAICIHQGSTEFECVKLAVDEDTQKADESRGTPDGRPCETRQTCERERGGDPQAEYLCEKAGLFGTFTVSGRVRWRGILADPNELSLAIGASLSFAFALHATARRKIKHLLLAMVLAIAGYCVVLSGSRGGVLVVIAVVGVYFVRRFGPKGLIVGAALAAPLLVFGGRSGEDAEASTLERIGSLYEGVTFFRTSPLFGLGFGQYVENYFITAHNSYLLAASELGFPGLFFWSMLLYTSMKTAYVLAMRPPYGLDPLIPSFAMALLVSFAGMLVGVFFLSFTYHPLLFIYLGLAGALFGAARRTVPWFDVKVKGADLAFVFGTDCLILAWLFVYTRIKGEP